MALWNTLFAFLFPLQASFSRFRTFFWSCICVCGFLTRIDSHGLTSCVRSLSLKPSSYRSLLHIFKSSGVNLSLLRHLWTQQVLTRFEKFLLRVNGRLVLVADATKIPKEGRRMPGVKCHHQESSNIKKPPYIMGHLFQSVAVLAQGAGRLFAVPLVSILESGLKFCPKDRATLPENLLLILAKLNVFHPCYCLVDNGYCVGFVARLLIEELGFHLVSRVRSNAVAYELPEPPTVRQRGRPRLYGQKVKLFDMFKRECLSILTVSIYGTSQSVQCWTRDLYWRQAQRLVRYVGVILPDGRRSILITTDLDASAQSIIELYSYRMKIEMSFKSAIRTVGAYTYRFWMQAFEKLKNFQGTQFAHKKSAHIRSKMKSKLQAYELFVHLGILSQGLLQYLALEKPLQVYENQLEWYRTLDRARVPSEEMVKNALRHTYILFFKWFAPKGHFFKKWIKIMDPGRFPGLLNPDRPQVA